MGRRLEGPGASTRPSNAESTFVQLNTYTRVQYKRMVQHARLLLAVRHRDRDSSSRRVCPKDAMRLSTLYIVYTSQ